MICFKLKILMIYRVWFIIKPWFGGFLYKFLWENPNSFENSFGFSFGKSLSNIFGYLSSNDFMVFFANTFVDLLRKFIKKKKIKHGTSCEIFIGETVSTIPLGVHFKIMFSEPFGNYYERFFTNNFRNFSSIFALFYLLQ